MAEDFPHYHEDSDSETPRERRVERRVPIPAKVEHIAPVGQEGTIFARQEQVARPLLSFIRQQESPAAEREASKPASAETHDISTPADPEVRTYQPLAEAEAHAQQEAAHEASKEADDDDDDETEDTAAPAKAKRAETDDEPTEPEEPRRQSIAEGLKAAIRPEETEVTHAAPEASTPTENINAEPIDIPPVAEYASHRSESAALPHAEATPLAAAAEEEPADEPVLAAGGALPPPPVPPHRPAAPYGHEGPEPLRQNPASGASERSMPDMPDQFESPNHEVAPMFANPAAIAETSPPAKSRQEKSHNGRWFAAGVLTGWVIKQYLANKKLARFQEASQKQAEQTAQTMNTMVVEQQDMSRKLTRTEGELQQLRASQAPTERMSANLPGAERPPAQSAAEYPVAEASQPVTIVPEQQRPLSASPFETPLQHPGVAETAFAAAGSAAGSEAARPQRTAEGSPVPTGAEKPPDVSDETAAAQEMVEQAYKLQPGQHIEHATGGGHNIIVDQHGHEVQNAMQYGKEFNVQRQQEQMRAGAYDAQSTPGSGASDGNDYGMVTGLHSAAPGLASGQADFRHELSSGKPSLAARQRLLAAKQRNPLATTMTSPWLWAAIIVLLAAFFVAAFV